VGKNTSAKPPFNTNANTINSLEMPAIGLRDKSGIIITIFAEDDEIKKLKKNIVR